MRRTPRARPRPHLLEPLESRLLLSVAVAASGKSATYTDSDGDLVTVKVSSGTLNPGNFVTVAAGLGEFLQTIDFSGGNFDHADLSVTVKKVSTGDGLANVGYIDSLDHDLGAVSIAGDLGRIDAGDIFSATPAVKSLTARSMGRLGLDNQPGGTFVLSSNITGTLSSLTIKADIVDAFLTIAGDSGPLTLGGSLQGGALIVTNNMGQVKIGGDVVGNANFQSGLISSLGKIAGVTIGGSLVGGSADDTGKIVSTLDMGPVKIGGDLAGAAGARSGAILSTAAGIASLTVGGSLRGASGQGSASVFARGTTLGPVKIAGSLIGGDGSGSAQIAGHDQISSISIGGSLIGGAHNASAGLFVVHGDMGPVTIGGDVRGGGDLLSGSINPQSGKLASLTIGGSLVGGTGMVSGCVFCDGDIGTVRIAGDLRGGTDNECGAIYSNHGSIKSVAIGGSLLGGSGPNGARIFAQADITSVTVGGSVVGGAGDSSGSIGAGMKIGDVKIAGDIRGGTIDHSGAVEANGTSGSITSITVGGSLIGGVNTTAIVGAGRIHAYNQIGKAQIAHDIRGGSGQDCGAVEALLITAITLGGSLIGGIGSDSGRILGDATLGSVTINGDLVGGSASGADSLYDSGTLYGTHVGAITIGGSIRAGTDDSSGTVTFCGAILAALDLKSLNVKGSILGSVGLAGDVVPVIIIAHGQNVEITTDVAIGSITVGHEVQRTNILAGYKFTLNSNAYIASPDNGDAQIGTVKVGGDWIASNLIAGARNNASANTNFGDANDSLSSRLSFTITAAIASIAIGGQVFGTPDSGTDHFGIVSAKISSLKIDGVSILLNPADHADNIPLGPNSDFNLHEV